MREHTDEVARTPDPFLEERLARVDGWLRDGRVPFSSRVIPIGLSLPAQQWVLPGEQVLGVLRGARVFALAHCICRSHYHRCDHPTEVCFILNERADRYLQVGRGRRVSLEEAQRILQEADARGLVHLAIYTPEQQPYAVCSCCACCCHDLQFLRLYGRSDLIAHSDYIARTDMESCTHCGRCVERCPFGARTVEGGKMWYDGTACYGCGLCASACEAGVTRLQRREVTQ